MIKKIKQRLLSKTIWLTSIAPSILTFLTLYSNELKGILNNNYQYVFMLFAVLAWISRELTTKHLNDK